MLHSQIIFPSQTCCVGTFSPFTVNTNRCLQSQILSDFAVQMKFTQLLMKTHCHPPIKAEQRQFCLLPRATFFNFKFSSWLRVFKLDFEPEAYFYVDFLLAAFFFPFRAWFLINAHQNTYRQVYFGLGWIQVMIGSLCVFFSKCRSRQFQSANSGIFMELDLSKTGDHSCPFRKNNNYELRKAHPTNPACYIILLSLVFFKKLHFWN